MRVTKRKLRKIIREEVLKEKNLSEGVKIDMIVKGLNKFKDQALPAIKAFFSKNPDLIDDAIDLLSSLTTKNELDEWDLTGEYGTSKPTPPAHKQPLSKSKK